MSKEIVARCGMRCDLCIAYVHHPDHESMEERKRASDVWEKYLGFRVEPGDIECRGCLDGECLMDKDCPVRPCVIRHGYESCAQCGEFEGCGSLSARLIQETGYGDREWGVLPKEDIRYLEAFINYTRLKEMRAG
jgi:hypothetical protein